MRDASGNGTGDRARLGEPGNRAWSGMIGCEND
jgi:hypothetical protein